MSTYVLDTSVAIAWYLPEEFSSAARDWQNQMLRGQATFVVPSLHYWEFGNVLRTYVRRRELEEDLALETYDLHREAPLDVLEPNRAAVLERALEYQATAYDAVYIELALANDLKLVTAERTTHPWIVKMGERVCSVTR